MAVVGIEALLKDATIWTWSITLLAALISYYCAIVIWRLYFHPLSRFPGPKIAAATGLYEFYYDFILPGQYTWIIGQMHEKYGPIVRISPVEIHINDPDFYDEVYTGAGKPHDKWPRMTVAFGNPTAGFGTVESSLHRIRRAPLNHFFAKRSVVQLQPAINKHVEQLCSRIAGFRGTDQPLSLKYAYAALTLDIVTEYAFANSYEALHDTEFAQQWLDSVESLMLMTYVSVYFPLVPKLMEKLPPSVVRIISPPMNKILDFRASLREQILDIMQNPEADKYKTKSHGTIFHDLLHSADLPAFDQNTTHFEEEAQTVVVAGQTTTAYHLTLTSYHLLANPEMLKQLKAELKGVMPDAGTIPPLEKLEKLEYLNAVICEGHRMSYGQVHRVQRISPHAPIVYQDWVMPPGTPVGMSTLLIHDNPDIFPSPEKFDPGRWLGPDGNKRKKYLVPFQRGTRSCLGRELANAELFLTLAAVFRRFDFELFETGRDAVDVAYDYFVPLPHKDSKGLRVMVK